MKYRCPKCGKEYQFYCCGPDLCATAPDDAAVVARFNELVKEGKIEYQAKESRCWMVTVSPFRIRPTPHYRPFTAVEAAGQLGRPVRYKENVALRYINWHIGRNTVSINDKNEMLFDTALNMLVFADTDEPFGVKESA